jgi:hypothetical protein
MNQPCTLQANVSINSLSVSSIRRIFMKPVPMFTLPTAKTQDGKSSLELVTLHDGSKVSRAFYNRVQQAALSGIGNVPFAEPKTLRKICGPGFWLTLSSRDAITAGLCGVTMALRYELPLDLAGKDHQNAQLYLRK